MRKIMAVRQLAHSKIGQTRNPIFMITKVKIKMRWMKRNYKMRMNLKHITMNLYPQAHERISF